MLFLRIQGSACTGTLWSHESIHAQFTQCCASTGHMHGCCDDVLEGNNLLFWHFNADCPQTGCNGPASSSETVATFCDSCIRTFHKYACLTGSTNSNRVSCCIGSCSSLVAVCILWPKGHEKVPGHCPLPCRIPGFWIVRQMGLLQNRRRYWCLLESYGSTMAGPERASTYGLGSWQESEHSRISSRWR